MGRNPTPWYRRSTRCWYVWHDGRQHKLHADKAEAYRLWGALLQPPTAQESTISPPNSPTVAEAVTAFLKAKESEVAVRTFKSYRSYCRFLSDRLGERALASVTAGDLLAWAKKWPSTSSQWLSLTIAQSVMRHAGVTPPKLVKPMLRSRGAEAVMSAEDYQRLYAASPKPLQDVLLALHDSGCRPADVRRVEARHFIGGNTWVLDLHKTSRKTSRPKLVVLTPALAKRCVELAALRPTGPLFLSIKGKPWTEDSLFQLVSHLCKRLSITTRLYGLRHGLATELLTAGVPDTHVAAILGHSNTAMLHRHYSHITAQTQTLRSALERVRGESPPQAQ